LVNKGLEKLERGARAVDRKLAGMSALDVNLKF